MLKMTSQVAEAASVVQGSTEWSQLNVSECEKCKAPVKPEVKRPTDQFVLLKGRETQE